MVEQAASDVNALVITREFDAPRERVWKAWTDPEMLKRWWGPEMFTAPSIRVDLRVGGKYVFAMRGPEGTPFDKVMYSAGVYKEIVVNEKLVSTDFFSDENGNMLDPTAYGQPPDAPREMTITVLFDDIGPGKTRLSIIYAKPETEAQYQTMLRSGMEEGWKSSLNKLAEALK